MTNETETAAQSRQMPPDAILSQMLWGGLMQQCIGVAAKLGIADLVAGDSQTAAELASRTGTHAASLYRFLRLLASAGIFAENGERKFELTPMSELLRSDAPGSMRDFALMLVEDWNWEAWSEIMYSLETGKPAHEKIQGMGSFEYFEKNKDAGKVFNRAMTNLSKMAVPAVVEAYDFSGAETLVDIAGGHGLLLAGILKANPNLKGVLFDLQFVIENAGELLEAEGVRDRVETATGDFFEAVTPGGNIYMMKHIIHDWNDEQSIKILKSIRAAIRPDGKVLLIEMVVPPGNVPHPSKMLDIEMLLIEGGKERTEAEYR